MTLIEIVVYTAILFILTLVVVNVVIAMNRTYRTFTSLSTVETSAEVSLERMTREIRDATSVDTAQSTLGSSPGQLMLNTTDASGTATTIQFFTLGQTLRVKEAGVDVGPLSGAARVSNLVFRKLVSAQATAVKIEMTLESGSGSNYESKQFYSTVVLRGSYPVQ